MPRHADREETYGISIFVHVEKYKKDGKRIGKKIRKEDEEEREKNKNIDVYTKTILWQVRIACFMIMYVA